MRRRDVTLLTAVVLLPGCITEPIVYTIRMKPDIERADDRTLSLQLITPRTTSPERTIHQGQLITAIIEKSQDSPRDFELGTLVYGEWNEGPIKLVINEDGNTHVTILGLPPAARHDFTLWVLGRIPKSPAVPELRWSAE